MVMKLDFLKRWFSIKKPHSHESTPAPAIVSRSLVNQAKSFTAPRGRLEMGGLLVGHVDRSGRNVCVVGFFPEQTEESPGYCEFDGGWMAVAAAAAEHANSSEGLPFDETPLLRVIGWIHTHPGFGLFLSGTDTATYEANLEMSPDNRFVAVVVDPLRNEDGVFLTPDRPNEHSPANGAVVLGGRLRGRYLKFLSKMEEIRVERGREELPFIMCGDLRNEHITAGNSDDYIDSYLQSVNAIRNEMKSMHERLEAAHISVNEAIAVVAERIDEIENRFVQLKDESGNPENSSLIEAETVVVSERDLPVMDGDKRDSVGLVSVHQNAEGESA